jgi:hypothetical protein
MTYFGGQNLQNEDNQGNAANHQLKNRRLYMKKGGQRRINGRVGKLKLGQGLNL